MTPIDAVSSGSQSNLDSASPADSSSLQQTMFAIKTFKGGLKTGDLELAEKAARWILSTGQQYTSPPFRVENWPNSLHVVGVFLDSLKNHETALSQERRYLFARIARLFSELTQIYSHRVVKISFKNAQQPTLEQLAPLAANAESNDHPDVWIELKCAKQACKRWASDDNKWARYYRPVRNLLIGATVSAAQASASAFVIKDFMNFLEDRYKEHKGFWYNQVFPMSFIGGHYSHDLEEFEKVHAYVGGLYGERFKGRRSKVLLAIVDALAEFVWKGNQAVQLRAMGGSGEPRTATFCPGLTHLIAVEPFKDEPSRGLWKVRYHAANHISALRSHRNRDVASIARDCLDNRVQDENPVVDKRLELLRKAPGPSVYRSSFADDLADFRTEGTILSPQKLPCLPVGGYITRALLRNGLKAELVTEGEMVTVCYGMGGVGKTSLALETVHDDVISGEYPRRLWFRNSDQPAELINQFSVLAREFHCIDDRNITPDELVRRVLTFLEDESDPFLIVFDNAGAPDSLKGYLPRRGGRILITTRDASWESRLERSSTDRGGCGMLRLEEEGETPETCLVSCHHVGVLQPEESCELVEKILKRKEPQASQLADAMGQHPLGLTHACAYLTQNGLSIDDFLESLRSYSKKFYEDHPPLREEPLPQSLIEVWDMTFSKLQDKPAMLLLNQLAYLAPDAIPSVLLGNSGEAEETLIRYSLLQEQTDKDRDSLPQNQTVKTYAVHHLLQGIVRVYHNQDKKKEIIGQLMEALETAYQRNPISDVVRENNFNLIPHGEAVCEAYRDLVAPDVTLLKAYRDTLAWLGNAYTELARAGLPTVMSNSNSNGGNSDQLEALSKAYATYAERNRINVLLYRNNDLYRLEAAASYEHQAVASLEIGGPDMAFAKYQKALEIRLHVNDPQVINTYDAIGCALMGLGRDAEALDYFRDGLRQADERTPDLGKANCLKHLGDNYHKLKDYKKARKVYRYVSAIYERIGMPMETEQALISIIQAQIHDPNFGSDKSSGLTIASTYEKLADALVKSGQLDEALKQLENALRFRSEVGDPHVVETYNMIGSVLMSLRRHDKAVEQLTLGLSQIHEEGFDWERAECLKLLGDAYVNLDDRENAWEAYQNARKLYEGLEDEAAEEQVLACLHRLSSPKQDVI